MSSNGVSQQQSEVIVEKVFPAARGLVPGKAPSTAQKQALKTAMTEVVNVEL